MPRGPLFFCPPSPPRVGSDPTEGQVILKINGEDITQKMMKDIGALIKSRPNCKMTLEGGDEGGDLLGNDANDVVVTLNRSGGNTLGVKLMKGPGGVGVAIKSVDVGGQAEKTKLIKAGDDILKINGKDVTKVSGMKEVGVYVPCPPCGLSAPEQPNNLGFLFLFVTFGTRARGNDAELFLESSKVFEPTKPLMQTHRRAHPLAGSSRKRTRSRLFSRATPTLPPGSTKTATAVSPQTRHRNLPRNSGQGPMWKCKRRK